MTCQVVLLFSCFLGEGRPGGIHLFTSLAYKSILNVGWREGGEGACALLFMWFQIENGCEVLLNFFTSEFFLVRAF